jgi:hypothetical protein
MLIESSVYLFVKGDGLWITKKDLRFLKSPNKQCPKSLKSQWPKSLKRQWPKSLERKCAKSLKKHEPRRLSMHRWKSLKKQRQKSNKVSVYLEREPDEQSGSLPYLLSAMRTQVVSCVACWK